MFKSITTFFLLITTLLLSGCGETNAIPTKPAPQEVVQGDQTVVVSVKVSKSIIEAGETIDYEISDNGNIASIEWRDINGKLLSTDKKFNRFFQNEGNYITVLTVTDKNGKVGTDTIAVKVNKASISVDKTPNKSPVVRAKAEALEIMEKESIHLSDDGSYDPDGSIVKYKWRDMDGILLSKTKKLDRVMYYYPQYDFNNDGTTRYIKTLFVTDDKGAVSSKSFTIIVRKKPTLNKAPTIEAGSDATITEGDSYTPNPTSSDTDGTITSTVWKEGATTLTFPKTDFTVGTHILTVTVTDNEGATATDTLTLTVITNQTPTATAQSVTLDEDTTKAITLSGTDPDGDALTYIVVTPPSHGTFANGVYTPNANYFGADSFTFKANDGIEDSTPATVLITINGVENTNLTIDQGLNSLLLEEGDKKLVSFIINFKDGDLEKYDILFEQTIEPSNGGLNLTSDYPNGGWIAKEDNSWIVNVTLDANVAGEYVIKSTAKIKNSNTIITIELPVSVKTLGSTGQIELILPGSSIDGIIEGTTKDVTFTAKVINTTTPPLNLILEEVDLTGIDVLNSFGALKDDGNSPDIDGGDMVYTGTFAINATTLGKRYFRVTSGIGADKITSGIHSILVTNFPVDVSPSDADKLTTDSEGNALYSNELAVKFVDGTSESRIQEIINAENAVIAGTIPSLAVFQIKIVGDGTITGVQNAIEEFESYAEVDFAEPVYQTQISAFPNDSKFSSQDNMKIVRADETWNIAKGKTTIAIIDTGVDYNHSDLTGKVIKGKDTVGGDLDPMDVHGHGTHVAGIAAAKSNNSTDVAGISWDSKILAIRGLEGSSTALASAIVYAADQGIKVINISGSITQTSSTLLESVKHASSKGALIVAAAGNGKKKDNFIGQNRKVYPCGYEIVLCVGNSTNLDAKATSSHYGSWIDIAAPGENVISTQLGGSTVSKTGTSMSSPLVAGAAAVVWSQHPSWSASKVRERLIKSGEPIASSLKIGSSRLDLFEAVFNGSFELGNLSEWEAIGTASSIKKLGNLTPTNGEKMAMLSTGPAGDQVQTTMKKTINIQDGVSELNFKFNYNYISDEYPEFVGTEYDDTLLIELISPDGTVTELAKETINASSFTPINGINLPGGDETVGETGFKLVDKTIPVTQGAGEYTINITDKGDDVYDSVLLIDHIRLK